MSNDRRHDVKRLLITSLILTSTTALALVGTAIYRWMTEGDKVTCVANEFSFGCSTVLGWLLTGAGILVVVGTVYIWERFRGE
jgi:hypothetical protein